MATWLQLTPYQTSWLYGIKVGSVLIALAWFSRDYRELRTPGSLTWAQWLLGITVGLLVFVVWIHLDQGWMLMGEMKGYRPVDATGQLDIWLIATRWLGAALIVPVMEELFWRSFLMRWLSQEAFLESPPQRPDGRAFWITAVLFGLEHQQWLAGIIAGVAYGWLYRQTGRISVPIVAHAVTNGVLGVWVVSTGQWQFW
ncbi:hypothetical protein HNQ59_002874 [Chitinivorax tropicus]|uniref:CAAX prenyl protease 2/Lysostaphin resistance protein A-like domain-containing protein n=1 Tax=Chitinivorax tropicus TaxID=714531 RepID=A0A840MS23_9PROT|nr:hypothetical protein [Chitinivorax tropicus]